MEEGVAQLSTASVGLIEGEADGLVARLFRIGVVGLTLAVGDEEIGGVIFTAGVLVVPLLEDLKIRKEAVKLRLINNRTAVTIMKGNFLVG